MMWGIKKYVSLKSYGNSANIYKMREIKLLSVSLLSKHALPISFCPDFKKYHTLYILQKEELYIA